MGQARNVFVILRRTRGAIATTALPLAMLPALSPRVARADGFPRGTITLSSDVSYTHTFDDEANIGAAQIGVNWFVLDNFSIGAEVSGYGFIGDEDAVDDAAAAGFSLTLRHHALRWDRMTLFVDASFGPMEANRDLPSSGTRFNYITRVGTGLTYQLDENLYLFAGPRYFHLSNARLEGIEHNPSMNGIECYLGLMWKL